MSGFLIALFCAIIIVAAYFLCFELKKPTAARLMPIVVLVALGSVGRVIFAFVPQFQPTTAIVIIAGAALGSTDGFMTGALCALVSNIILGHGAWTPFQMIAWGTVGALAGVVSKFRFGETLVGMTIYSALAAFLYSLIMDTYTVSSLWQIMTSSYALTIYSAGLFFNILQMIGNIVFMLILYVPFNHMLKRVRLKYL